MNLQESIRRILREESNYINTNVNIGDIYEESDIYQYIQKLHYKRDYDFWEGDLGERIEKFPYYVVKEIPVKDIEMDEYQLDDDDMEEYIEMFEERGSYPPIVLGKKSYGYYNIIDGTHRANALRELGFDKIICFVGKKKSNSQELDEYARTLKNARQQGVGLRFPKSAIKAKGNMNLQENIHRINSIMDEGKDAHISRERYDQEYEEEYPKWGKIMVKFLSTEISSYSENDDTIVLFNNKNNDKYLMRYDKKNEHLWWDYSLEENIVKFIPYGYISRHFKYAIQDYFKKHFPDYGVRQITAANIG